MPDVTIQHNGQDITVPLEAVALPDQYVLLGPGEAPEGFVPESAVNAKVNEKMKHAKRTLSQDADFVQSILAASGVPLDDDGRPAIPKPGKDIDVAKLQDAWAREHLEPIKGQITAQEAQIKRLLASRKRSEIFQAAIAAGVRDEFLKPATGKDGDPTVWENMIGGYLDYDPDNDMFAVREGEGFAYSSGKNGKPWAGVSDFHERARKNEALKGFFKDNRPGDTGLGSTNGASGAAYRISQEDARDTTKYRAAKAAADKAGKTLEIV